MARLDTKLKNLKYNEDGKISSEELDDTSEE